MTIRPPPRVDTGGATLTKNGIQIVNGFAHAALASVSVSGHSGSSSLTVRILLAVIFVGLIALLFALRSHRILQLSVAVPAILITAFFEVRAQISAGMREPQRTHLVPKAPTACLTSRADNPTADLAPLSEAEDLGYPTKTLNRIEVRDLLIDASYDALDSMLTAYSDSARRDFRFEYRMIDAFGAFSTAATTFEPFLDDWVLTRPSSGNALLVRATYYIAAGWHARGAASMRNTSFGQVMGAQGYLTRALADLTGALRLLPCSVVAYKGLMTIANYFGDTAMSRAAMDQALLIQPYSFVVREEHMLNLRPRWGGSYEAMELLAQAADTLSTWNPRLRVLHGFADLDQADLAVREKETGRALELYQHALSFGDFWRFRFERGQLHHWMGRDEQALADLERALVQRPQYPDLLDRLASAKYELGRYARGSEQHRLFYEAYGDESLAALLDPADEDFQKSMAFYKESIPEYAH